jgi:hypothetical protein
VIDGNYPGESDDAIEAYLTLKSPAVVVMPAEEEVEAVGVVVIPAPRPAPTLSP